MHCANVNPGNYVLTFDLRWLRCANLGQPPSTQGDDMVLHSASTHSKGLDA